ERVGAGGDRLATLEQELHDTGQILRERTARKERFDALLADADLMPVTTSDEFCERKAQASSQRATVETARVEADHERFTYLERAAQVRRELVTLDEELASLKERKNNLPRALVRVRDELCA